MLSIAVIGSGISGLMCAYRLRQAFDVEVFEARASAGGHTRTEEITVEGRTYPVDVGFIVYNEKNYPNFTRLLSELEVPTRPTEMSFSVSCARTGLEYNGHTLQTLFAQRRNLLRPSFYRLLREIIRFNRFAKRYLRSGDPGLSVEEMLRQGGFSDDLGRLYLLPMGAAIWSASRDGLRDFPAVFFLRFLHNHGLLDLWGRPRWRTVVGGSRTYVDRLLELLPGRVHRASPVRALGRDAEGVEVVLGSGKKRRFDKVIIATHSDQALALLETPTASEEEILSALRYQDNEVVLHTDISCLPRERRAWASWNYCLSPDPKRKVAVTYNMNILQGLEGPQTFCVTLNPERVIDPEKVLRRLSFAHPQYSLKSEAARRRRGEINGENHTFFCGAYWGAGFHEDGVVSALDVCRLLEEGP